MSRDRSVNLALISMVIDGLCVAASLGIATLIRPWMSGLPLTQEIDVPLVTPWILYPLFSITWVGILLLLAAYDPARQAHRIDELTQLTIGSLLAAMALAGMLYLSFRDVSRALFITFTILAYILMLTWRFLPWPRWSAGNKPRETSRRVIIVGQSDAGRQLFTETEQKPELGLQVVGFVADQPQSNNDGFLGTLEEIGQIIRQYQINDVVVASPYIEHDAFRQMLGDLQALQVNVWMIPAYYHLAVQQAVVDEYAGMPMLELTQPAFTSYQRVIKRAFDLVVGSFLLLFSLPLMGLAAIAIRIECPGPVILKQQRLGENGQLFDMLKFRTMVPGADRYLQQVAIESETGQPIYKTADDPRITRVGRFLRRASLDELPQLWNILHGDMSLVGPRPELPQLLDLYAPWQRQRFTIPQGLTGWWQINGRSDKPMHLNSEYDLYYIHHHSLLLDVYILIKTVITVLRGEGAF
jgi:exopolysaccharide biosynthesis polyprenyl glycosylphosphotransferase